MQNGARLIVEELPAAARRAFEHGAFLNAYDIAQQALVNHPASLALRHLAVLCLANAGAPELALTMFRGWALHDCEDAELLALHGRLYKDLAYLASASQHQSLLAQAASLYERAAACAADAPDSYYPAINAASLALLCGRPAASEMLAKRVLTLLEPRLEAARARAGPDDYWLLATAIEASILAGGMARAAHLMHAAQAAGAGNDAALASTHLQLTRILAARGLSSEIAAPLAPGEIIHYVGHIIAAPGTAGRFIASEEIAVANAIDLALGTQRIAAAYGSLAAGADILFAEAVLSRGARLHLILPFQCRDFVRYSVVPSGGNWLSRFRRCLRQAATIRFATTEKYLNDDVVFAYSGQMAMGLAVIESQHLRARLRQCAVWDGFDDQAEAGTAWEIRAWTAAGLAQKIIACGQSSRPESQPIRIMRGGRVPRAMLFCDLAGFSRLTDAQLPPFTRDVLGALGHVIDRYRSTIDFINTWGDGIFLVFTEPVQAARCALALRDAAAQLNWSGGASLRVGGHYGPVHRLIDPIMQRPNFYGGHVNRAARTEPIVPPGCVHVTEAFAAVLALNPAQDLRCDYMGRIELPKAAGAFGMFQVRGLPA